VKKERIKFNRREDDEKYSEEEVLNEITPKIRRSADAIKDDNLRYQFLLAAGSCLARRKKMKDSQ
jgi:hypothetical protein